MIVRDFRETPESEPEDVLALTRDAFRRALNLRSDAQVRDALGLLETAGYLLSDRDRPERWVRRAPYDRRGPGRDRMFVFRGALEPLRLRQVWHGLQYDAGRRPQVRVVPL